MYIIVQFDWVYYFFIIKGLQLLNHDLLSQFLLERPFKATRLLQQGKYDICKRILDQTNSSKIVFKYEQFVKYVDQGAFFNVMAPIVAMQSA
jgi:hypothetical protein